MNKVITNIYFAGIGLSVALAFSIPFGTLAFDGNTLLFLAIGASHVALLSFLGYQLKPDVAGRSKIYDAGRQIENAGYFHTLIGFMLAVLELSQDPFNFENLGFPLASALITSLLGWLFGGEVKARVQVTDISLELAEEKFVNTLDHYCETVQEIEKKHVASLDKRLVDITKIHKQHQEQIHSSSSTHFSKMNSLFEQYIGEFQATYRSSLETLENILAEHRDNANQLHRDISRESQDISTALTRLQVAFQDRATTLPTSMNNLKVAIESQVLELEQSARNYTAASGNLSQATADLEKKFNRMKQETEAATTAVQQITQSARSSSQEVSQWAIQMSDCVQRLNQLISELQALAHYIKPS